MLSSNKSNGSVIDISSHQKMLYGGCDISEELWQKGLNREMGRTRGRYCCACLVFPAFPAPSSWRESDAWGYQGETQWWVSKQPSRVHHMFNKGSPMSQLWDTVSLFPGYSSVLRVAPGAQEPYFAAIMLATCIPSPSFNFGCWRMKRTPWGAFIEKRLEAKFLGGFFRLKSEAMHTHTRARITDGGERASVSLITASAEQLMSWNWR